MVSIAQYRQKPISQHSAEDRKKYVADMKRLHGDKMKRGKKVLVNIRGKNVSAVIMKDVSPASSSIEVARADGKVMRKDIATIYGIEGESSSPPRPPRGTPTQQSIADKPPKPLPTQKSIADKPPKPLPRDKPAKPSRKGKKMSEEHKSKIRAGVKKYHSGCLGGRKNKEQVKNLKAEVSKLKSMLK